MTAYVKDLKRLKKSGRINRDEIQEIVRLLAMDAKLPARLRDHALSGPYRKVGIRDCHVKPDLILLYSKPGDELHLMRLGSHSEVLG